MKKITLFFSLISMVSVAQDVNEKRDYLLNRTFGEDTKKADSTYARLEREFPNDSLVLAKKANFEWTYGSLDQKMKMIDEAIRLYTILDKKYNFDDFKLYLGSCYFYKCRIPYYDLKSLKKDKSYLLADFEKAKTELETYKGKAQSEKLNTIANRNLAECISIIKTIKYN